jgi:DNA-binding transcriptional MerR regulator
MTALRAVEPARENGLAAPREGSPWPQQLSHEPELRVSDVLNQLVREFPALTPSKLRFLDSNGLVSPHRTGSGYRQYSAADVERLRFVLAQQRDRYLPLSAIAEQLADLDAGRIHQPVGPHAVGETSQQVTATQLAEAAGVSLHVVETLTSAGVIAPASPGRFERTVVPLVVAGAAYLDTGADPRSLAALVRAAAREAQLARDAASPRRQRGDDHSADATLSGRADAAIAVFSACVHQEIDR